MSARPECRIVLASASPRRRRLISWLGLPVELTAVDTPEDLDSPLAKQPTRLAAYLAAEKAVAAAPAGVGGIAPDRVVVAFDTLVLHDGAVLGKPRDVQDAWRMLRALSGRTHKVVTGVAVLSATMDEPATIAVTTNVHMKTLSDAAIAAWMGKGEFMGCAGAYNIEGQVAEVDLTECFQNVAGLPLCHLREFLRSLDLGCELAGLTSPIAACDDSLCRNCLLGPSIVGDSDARAPAREEDGRPQSG